MWSGTTPWMIPSEARFLVALLQGRGHVWNFDDTTDYLYSSKGLFPATGDNHTARNTSAKQFGDAGLEINAGEVVTFDTGYVFDWTVMLWKGDADFNPVNHYIVNSNGNKWVDGVRNDGASTAFITESAGVFTLADATSVTQSYFDDLVIIDEAIDAAWAEDLGTMNTAFGPLPLLRNRGAMLNDQIHHVIGQNVGVSYAQGTVDGTFYNDLMQVEFELHQHTRLS
jgi:hypothetical protein